MTENRYALEFMQFIIGLEQGAWMSLGKIQNPVSGKVEKDLNQVKAIIDTLLMFREKTKNNLTNDEESLLKEIISQLEINYVDEVKKEPLEKKPEEEETIEKEKPIEEDKIKKEDKPLKDDGTKKEEDN